MLLADAVQIGGVLLLQLFQICGVGLIQLGGQGIPVACEVPDLPAEGFLGLGGSGLVPCQLVGMLLSQGLPFGGQGLVKLGTEGLFGLGPGVVPFPGHLGQLVGQHQCLCLGGFGLGAQLLGVLVVLLADAVQIGGVLLHQTFQLLVVAGQELSDLIVVAVVQHLELLLQDGLMVSVPLLELVVVVFQEEGQLFGVALFQLGVLAGEGILGGIPFLADHQKLVEHGGLGLAVALQLLLGFLKKLGALQLKLLELVGVGPVQLLQSCLMGQLLLLQGGSLLLQGGGQKEILRQLQLSDLFLGVGQLPAGDHALGGLLQGGLVLTAQLGQLFLVGLLSLVELPAEILLQLGLGLAEGLVLLGELGQLCLVGLLGLVELPAEILLQLGLGLAQPGELLLGVRLAGQGAFQGLVFSGKKVDVFLQLRLHFLELLGVGFLKGLVLLGELGELFPELPKLFGPVLPVGRPGLGGRLGLLQSDGQQHLGKGGEGLELLLLLLGGLGEPPGSVFGQSLQGGRGLQQRRDGHAELFPQHRDPVADGEAVVFFLQLLQRGDGAPVGVAVDPLDEGLPDKAAGDGAVALLIGQMLLVGKQQLHQGLTLPPGHAVPVGQVGQQRLAHLEILGLLGGKLEVQGLVQVEIQVPGIGGAAVAVGVGQENADGGGAHELFQLVGVLIAGKAGLDGQLRGQEGIDLGQKLHGPAVEVAVLLQLQQDAPLFQDRSGGQLHQRCVLGPDGRLHTQGRQIRIGVLAGGHGEAASEQVVQIMEHTGPAQKTGAEEIGVVALLAPAVGAGGTQGQKGHHVLGPAGLTGQLDGAVADEHGALLRGQVIGLGQSAEAGKGLLHGITAGLEVQDAQLAQEGLQLPGLHQLPGAAGGAAGLT